MAEKIDSPLTENLNAEGIQNRPVCPVCQSYLESAGPDYRYKKLNPDTRWFYCTSCEGHLGYHRMRKKWIVDPYDLETSPTFREYFSLDSLEE